MLRGAPAPLLLQQRQARPTAVGSSLPLLLASSSCQPASRATHTRVSALLFSSRAKLASISMHHLVPYRICALHKGKFARLYYESAPFPLVEYPKLETL